MSDIPAEIIADCVCRNPEQPREGWRAQRPLDGRNPA